MRLAGSLVVSTVVTVPARREEEIRLSDFPEDSLRALKIRQRGLLSTVTWSGEAGAYVPAFAQADGSARYRLRHGRAELKLRLNM